ncbi:hypothetical protein OIO90_002200 [Microbotryomycetes sp. JL221]|nr:hypothetical protein OIO90_002200 [Microbotryomycetes sp. JL221]
MRTRYLLTTIVVPALWLTTTTDARPAPQAATTSSSVATTTTNPTNPTSSASAVAPSVPIDVGFYNATAGGGSFLTLARNSGGLGEPLNVVISNTSDRLLMTDEGFIDYMWSVQMSEEFLGQSLGARQAANLGDGQGQHNQTGILRYNFYDRYYGTVRQSINGGNHVRYWRQNGTDADTGAWFLAVSVEMSAADNHMIVPNGYDSGRDQLVGNATMSNGTISPITNRTFSTTVDFLQGYLEPGTNGVNHAIPIDGRLAMLTVKVTNNGSAATLESGASFVSATTNVIKATLWSVVGAAAVSMLL